MIFFFMKVFFKKVMEYSLPEATVGGECNVCGMGIVIK
ncbi:Putative protein [Zobellia galactanivorans]|uniref:Uncharacterized protein n=1 Tax=Zobellia galactanivorans (strain DSM 12802 / CCUG 47099 / CIP 106680 / NCIMB 13871 / Dsij) TaxID=63186 RepID=G0L3L8_ZOBGA|nr:Putative protein [Zobellia galactanivorans]